MRTIFSTTLVAAAVAIQLADTETKSFTEEFAEFLLVNFDLDQNGLIQRDELIHFANFMVGLEDLSRIERIEEFQTYGSETGEELWFTDTTQKVKAGENPLKNFSKADYASLLGLVGVSDRQQIDEMWEELENDSNGTLDFQETLRFW